jgi:hypothetical protein
MQRAHTPYEGQHTLDLTDLQGRLLDLSAAGRRGLRTQLEGFADAQAELTVSAEGDRSAAGISPEVFAHFLLCTDLLARIEEGLAIAAKLAEVLRESRAWYIDAQLNDIALMVDTMRSTAKRRRDRSILNPFERTLRYHGQVGHKGAQTKQRMAAETPTVKAAKAKTGTRKKVARKPAMPAGAGPEPRNEHP